jgi:4-hydroxy-tetrahydrodipicolinate synthase
MMALDPAFLTGSCPPLITPFTTDGAVDLEAYGRFVDFQIRQGTHGIVVNGTTAEPATLTLDERNRLVDAAVEAAGRRVPVIAATGSQSHAETLALTLHAARAGADAVMIVTPYYIKPPQRGIIAYFKDLAARVPLPVLMYHIPGRTAVEVKVQTLEAIAEAAPNFVGMKHASLDLALVTDALLRLGRDFRIFVGLEELSFPMLALGACGLMNAVGNLAPRKVAELFQAVARGDLARGRALHVELWELNRAVFFDTNPIPMKYMMKRLGIIPANTHRLPMLPATREVEARCDGVLERMGLLP